MNCLDKSNVHSSNVPVGHIACVLLPPAAGQFRESCLVQNFGHSSLHAIPDIREWVGCVCSPRWFQILHGTEYLTDCNGIWGARQQIAPVCTPSRIDESALFQGSQE